jgi:hypothetical protein
MTRALEIEREVTHAHLFCGIGGGAIVKTCTYNLPYPAPRCGAYSIECKKCGFVGVVTVAGRPDDPNMITLPCGEQPH